jgi:hypothetical protein
VAGTIQHYSDFAGIDPQLTAILLLPGDAADTKLTMEGKQRLKDYNYVATDCS